MMIPLSFFSFPIGMCLISPVLSTQYERSIGWMIFLSTPFFKKIGRLFRIPLGKVGVNMHNIVYKNDKCVLFSLSLPPPTFFKANTLDSENKPINKENRPNQTNTKKTPLVLKIF